MPLSFKKPLITAIHWLSSNSKNSASKNSARKRAARAAPQYSTDALHINYFLHDRHDGKRYSEHGLHLLRSVMQEFSCPNITLADYIA